MTIIPSNLYKNKRTKGTEVFKKPSVYKRPLKGLYLFEYVSDEGTLILINTININFLFYF